MRSLRTLHVFVGRGDPQLSESWASLVLRIRLLGVVHSNHASALISSGKGRLLERVSNVQMMLYSTHSEYRNDMRAPGSRR